MRQSFPGGGNCVVHLLKGALKGRQKANDKKRTLMGNPSSGTVNKGEGLEASPDVYQANKRRGSLLSREPCASLRNISPHGRGKLFPGFFAPDTCFV
ncbi:hypothetical protein AVEN_75434-1 [Araneus ventricosus]|uniref:Uncharacterized protein n=1 Tax=Araneus ventricosus TaxID=182803 RepID=A0A4Y2UUY1_ARAVE|nr:hypothetical protein AVEN_75434-1 [Araneus ventricosus]